jgi:hydroxyethylthiazole kinase-like sugar kinase family protein
VNDLPGTLTAIGALVAALTAAFIAYRNSRTTAEAKAAALAAKLAAAESKTEIVATRDGVFELGKRVDGRLEELLELTKQSALAAGRLEGRASQRANNEKERKR